MGEFIILMVLPRWYDPSTSYAANKEVIKSIRYNLRQGANIDVIERRLAQGFVTDKDTVAMHVWPSMRVEMQRKILQEKISEKFTSKQNGAHRGGVNRHRL